MASTGRAMSQQDQRHLFRVDRLHIFNSIVNILSISFSYIINIIIIYYQYIQRLTVFIAFISIFAVVKLFPLSLELLKPPATYAIFAFIRFIFNFKFQPYIPFHLLNRHPPTRNLRSQNSFVFSIIQCPDGRFHNNLRSRDPRTIFSRDPINVWRGALHNLHLLYPTT